MAVKISLKAFGPDGKFDYNIFKNEVRKSMRNINKPELFELFKGTVEGWEAPPVFRGTIASIGGGAERLLVQPTGKNADIYNLVSAGSPPHSISPVNSEYLRFRTGYRSATKPGSLSSQRKVRFGSYVQAAHVEHPGFEGRRFDELIAKKYTPRFEETMHDAIAKATRRQNSLLSKIIKFFTGR